MEDFSQLTAETYNRNKLAFSSNLISFKIRFDFYVASIRDEHAPVYTIPYIIVTEKCADAAAALTVLVENALDWLPQALQEVEQIKIRLYDLRRRLIALGNDFDIEVLYEIYNDLMGLDIERKHRKAKKMEKDCRQAVFDHMHAIEILYRAEVGLKSLWFIGNANVLS